MFQVTFGIKLLLLISLIFSNIVCHLRNLYGGGGRGGRGERKGEVDGYLSGLRKIGDWPIVVMALLLYGGLNYKTFRWRFLFLFSCLLACGAWQTNYLCSLLYLIVSS